MSGSAPRRSLARRLFRYTSGHPQRGPRPDAEAGCPLLSKTSPRTLAASVIVPSSDRPKMLSERVASILAGNELPRELVAVD